MQNTHFSGLTRKNPAFERSVLMYESIKNRILTPSGQKRRVCVNAADRLLPPEQRTNSFAFLLLSPIQPQVAKTNSPSAAHSFSAFQRSPSKAGRGVAFLILARAKRRRWLVLGEFAKYAFCVLKRKRRDFERSVLKYVSIKIPALAHSGRKSRFCVNAADRLLPPSAQNLSPSPAAESQPYSLATQPYRSK